MDTIAVTFSSLVAVIMALTQVVKMYVLGSKWAALSAVAFGLIGGYFFIPGGIATALFTGLVAGLTAAGLYSGTAAMAK